MKQVYIAFILALLTTQTTAQNTNISGVINTYNSVSAISGNDVTVVATTGFSVGDRVMIIQMQGATIDETNSANFGDVTSYGDAGNYEFTSICAIPDGTTLTLMGIQRTYDPSGIVQVVTVPQYLDATITSTLTASPWDGSTGGILAFECSGSLTVSSGIDVDGLGFRGGTVTTSSYSCSWFTDVSDYFYDISSGEGAMKGEGIANYISGKTGGKGAQGNGGGGSNDHNGGGGGGSNAGAGGLGGERIRPSTFTCRCASPGVGGNDLTYSNANNKIFLGGGGGAGHENDVNTATAGASGGGIVIIRANSISGTGQTINANGASQTISSVDGAGGAGAGGTVLMDANTFTGTLTVNTNGGNGGDVSNIGPSNCNGPGGGGGGGILWVNQGSIPGAITYSTTGGSNGTTVATTQSNCTLNGANGATSGSSGSSVTGLTIVESNCSASQVANTASICTGDSLFLEGAWQTNSGTYLDTVVGLCCDTVYTTTLSVNSTDFSANSQTICVGDSLFLGGSWQNSAGVYSDTLQNAIGCDSVIESTLQVNSSFIITNNASLCDNDSIFLQGAWQTTAGTYSDTLQSASGCDSIVETSVIELTTWNESVSVSICDDDSIYLENNWQTIGGTFVDVYQSLEGCDSTVTTTLSLDLTYSVQDSIAIPQGDSAFLAGSWQTSSGIYTDTYLSIDGCDSAVATTLNVITGMLQNQFNSLDIVVYPNPFKNSTTIDFSHISQAKGALKLYNSTGVLVRFVQVPRGGKYILERGDLAAGLYYFDLEIIDVGRGFGKLIIE